MCDIPKEKNPLTHTQKNLSEEKIVSEGKKTRESTAHQVPRSTVATRTHARVKFYFFLSDVIEREQEVKQVQMHGGP